jgi:hypothetical protein
MLVRDARRHWAWPYVTVRWNVRWVDSHGQRKAMGILHPAEVKGMRSYSGHSFVLTQYRPAGDKWTEEEEAASVVAAFTARGESSRAIVREGGARAWELRDWTTVGATTAM